eukprot:Ihof_evm7s122 gene=Ihof_evmTU7s122
MPTIFEPAEGDRFAVEPLTTCPHEQAHPHKPMSSAEVAKLLEQGCRVCDDKTENWLCMNCNGVMCSRYVNGHMFTHVLCSGEHTPDCQYAISFSDLSTWCFECDSYITSPSLREFLKTVWEAKSAMEEAEVREEAMKSEHAITEVTKEPHPGLATLAKDIKAGKYRNIIVVTGAGISTSCGIPDFRSEHGLYAMLDTYDGGVGLSEPTDIFNIEYFKSNPGPFYTLCKNLLYANEDPHKPSVCHYFLRLLQDKGLLRRIYTQNIDGLEYKAGLREDVVVACHGGGLTAHCINMECEDREYDIETLKNTLREDKIPTCATCGALVKPDITFFGEDLPDQFYELLQKDTNDLRQSVMAGVMQGLHRLSIDDSSLEEIPATLSTPDLVIVMGTSLTVAPVKLIPRMFRSLPMVLFN